MIEECNSLSSCAALRVDRTRRFRIGNTCGAASSKYSDVATHSVKLSASVKKANADDAGLVDYGALDPATLWDLRLRIGATLDAAKPPPKNKLLDLRTPPRDVSKLPTIGAIPQ